MPQSGLDAIIARIHALQEELELSFDTLIEEKQRAFNYTIRKGRVIFNRSIRELHHKYKTGLFSYLLNTRLLHFLSSPVIYSVIVPLVCLDIFITLYQHICFRIYHIPIVRRSDYIVIDRHHLAYLNAIEKFNCIYCGYGNGLIEYTREVIARTEQYWCPIKHARRVSMHHDRVTKFSEYGDAEHYKQKLRQLRKEFKAEVESARRKPSK
ncbi:MAG TPA: hypothetical protein ENJ08_05675 [Gammaproteobacteria bacterium]|nr:hypothetical protein [Gammaproteobacteria bacterium]